MALNKISEKITIPQGQEEGVHTPHAEALLKLIEDKPVILEIENTDEEKKFSIKQVADVLILCIHELCNIEISLSSSELQRESLQEIMLKVRIELTRTYEKNEFE